MRNQILMTALLIVFLAIPCTFAQNGPDRPSRNDQHPDTKGLVNSNEKRLLTEQLNEMDKDTAARASKPDDKSTGNKDSGNSNSGNARPERGDKIR